MLKKVFIIVIIFIPTIVCAENKIKYVKEGDEYNIELFNENFKQLEKVVQELNSLKSDFKQKYNSFKEKVPLGTILAFYSDSKSLEGSGWVVCNAENHKRYPKIVPNLENRFLLGVRESEKGKFGGTAIIPPDGNHDHGGKTNGFGGYQPGQVNYDRRKGHGDPFMMRFNIDSAKDHNHGGNNMPPYFSVIYIIKIQ